MELNTRATYAPKYSLPSKRNNLNLMNIQKPAPIPRAQAEKHSDFPWRVIAPDVRTSPDARWSIVDANGVCICDIPSAACIDRPQEELLLNAKLLASAPALQAQNARLRDALERANNTLRSVEATLGTIDSDERYRAREEGWAAIVHMTEIKQIKVAQEYARQALAAPQEPTS